MYRYHKPSLFEWILLLTLMLISFSYILIECYFIPTQKETFYVNDFSKIFSEEEIDILVDNAENLSEKEDINIVISTVNSFIGITYPYRMFSNYEIGKRGILILFCREEEKIHIYLGDEIKSYFNDKKDYLIENFATPSLNEDRLNEGLINLQKAFISEANHIDEKTLVAKFTQKDVDWFDFLLCITGILGAFYFGFKAINSYENYACKMSGHDIFGILLVLTCAVFLIVNTQITLTSLEEDVTLKQSELEADMQELNEIIPDIVECFKEYADSNYEKCVLNELENLDIESANSYDYVNISLHRLLDIADDYPSIKGSVKFIALEHEFEEIEEKIFISRLHYNDAVRRFNAIFELKNFPRNVIALIGGYQHLSTV